MGSVPPPGRQELPLAEERLPQAQGWAVGRMGAADGARRVRAAPCPLCLFLEPRQRAWAQMMRPPALGSP